MTSEPIGLTHTDHVAVVTIAPAAAALPPVRFRAELGQTLQRAIYNPHVLALAIIGGPNALDLGAPAEHERTCSDLGSQAWLQELLLGPTPVVVGLNRTVAGAGLAIACLGDFIVATEDVTFRPGSIDFSYLALGWTLIARIGEARTNGLLLAEHPVSGADAQALQLVNELATTNDLADRVLSLATGMAGRQPELGLSKRNLRSTIEPSLRDYLNLERRLGRSSENPGPLSPRTNNL